MEVTCDGKWFWVEPPSGSVAEAAELIVALRVQDVQRFLPLAARHDADDVEYVHQLRVSCRRAAAALRAFEPVAGRGCRKLKRWLQRLRRAAGPARDADVYLARLRAELSPADEHAQQLVDMVAQARTDAQRDLIRVERKAARGGLERALDACLRRFDKSRGGPRDQSFATYAEDVLDALAEELDAVDVESAALADLHQFRIAAKRLRYAIEIFHSAAAPELRGEIYPAIEEIQERLGALNDHVASQQRLQRWLADMPPDGLAAFVAGLIVAEQSAAQRRRREFDQWWTPQRQTTMREQLRASIS
jgi:CHAD domain-containing protein